MVGDLMPLVYYTANQPCFVHSAAVRVLAVGGVVVVFHAAPRGRSRRSAFVGVVFARVADHVKRAVRAVFFQRVEQHIGQRPAAEGVRLAGQSVWTVVKGHGADALGRADPLDAAGFRDKGLRLCKPSETAFDLFCRCN